MNLKKTLEWRKAAGVEPTWEWLTPPTGFEARPHHRVRLPSSVPAVLGQSGDCSGCGGLYWWVLPLPVGTGAQGVGIAHAAG